MAVTHYTITANFADLLGTAYPTTGTTRSPVVAWLETNVGGSEGVVDSLNDLILLGPKRQTADNGGLIEWANVIGSDSDADDINLADGTLQYRVTAEYVNALTRKRGERWSSGWFSLTADVNLADVVAEQYIPATAISQATAALDAIVAEGQALLDAQEVISGLTGEDDAVALLINTPSSDTADALNDSYADHLVATTGNEAATINAYLSSGVPLGVKKKRLVGDFTIGSTVTVPAGVELDLSAATITHSVAAEHAVTLGAGAKIRGGKIISPATFDGTNTAWTYAVVNVTGDGASVEGLTLENVPKVGIGFRNVDSGIVRGCRIEGNYPSGSWTGTETGHFGVTIDASGSSADGNFVISGNIIRTCVQGVYLGNYGSAATGRGVSITGNAFNSCWNHGVYGSNGAGYSVTGNVFNRCGAPVALTGSYHVVADNAMTTAGTGTNADLAGISLRDPIGCIVSNNTIQGDGSNGSVIVDLRQTSGTTIRDNVVTGNVIDIAGGASQAIRVGASATTVLENNLIQGNSVRCVGASNTTGLIALVNDSASLGIGNRILDNVIVMLGVSQAIYAAYQNSPLIRGNHVRLEFNAGSAVTLSGVYLVGNTTTGARVYDNTFILASTWGTNVTFRAIWENTGVTSSRISRNTYSLSATLATSVSKYFLASGSGSIITEYEDDNTYDLGASSAQRPKRIYAGTSFVLPGFTTAGRPTAASMAAGGVASDTTLGRPIYSPDGSAIKVVALQEDISGAGGGPGTFRPTDMDLLMANGDPKFASTNMAAPTSGVLYVFRMKLDSGTVLNNILTYVAIAGSTLTSGQNLVGVYSDSGATLLGSTADQSTAWASTGPKTMALSSQITGLTTGNFYRVAFLFNGTTAPRFQAFPAGLSNFGVASTSHSQGATISTGLTALPSSIATGSLVSYSGSLPLVAAS